MPNRAAACLTSLALLLGGLLSGGCASVEFTADGDDENVGFRYYPAKPYLVVERDGGKLSARVLSLPDLTDPRRVRYASGWGTVSFGFDTEHGMLTKFNATADGKGPEALTAVASLGSAYAAALSAEAELLEAEAGLAMTLLGPTEGPDPTDASGARSLYPVLELRSAKKTLEDQVLAALQPVASLSPALKQERVVLESSRDELQELGTLSYDGTDAQLVKAIAAVKTKVAVELAKLRISREVLEGLARPDEAGTANPGKAKRAAEGLDVVIGTLAAFAEAASPLELYEILLVDDVIKLRRVRFTS